MIASISRFLARKAIRFLLLLLLIVGADLWLGFHVVKVEDRVTIIEQRVPQSVTDELHRLQGEVAALQARTGALGPPSPTPRAGSAPAPSPRFTARPTPTPGAPSPTSSPAPTPGPTLPPHPPPTSTPIPLPVPLPIPPLPLHASASLHPHLRAF